MLYWNFLPFGYNKTFTIQVGSASDTSGQFYLEPSRDLSERKTAPDGTTYRELNGLAYAVFDPKAVLKNAQVTVSVEGDGVSLTPIQLDFNPASVSWNNSWDFTQNKQPSQLGLTGSAYPFDNCMYFDGKSKLDLPYSYNQFEKGSFSVYAEWTPKDSIDDFQEIVGHYNWELLQNKDSVTFQVGRMNNVQGPFYSINYPVSLDFFNQKHSALAIYSPDPVNGYIDLYIDGHNTGRTYIGTAQIWTAYNSNQNFTLGKSNHGIAKYFKGCISSAHFVTKVVIPSTKNITFTTSNADQIRIPIISTSSSIIHSITARINE